MSQTKAPKGRIDIRAERCKGCYYCIDACPNGTIHISPDHNLLGYFPAAVLHPESCNGCALCAQVCPDVAITVWRLKKSKSDEDAGETTGDDLGEAAGTEA